jgi:hypothetical protein
VVFLAPVKKIKYYYCKPRLCEEAVTELLRLFSDDYSLQQGSTNRGGLALFFSLFRVSFRGDER